jgi:hypothetical protein
MLNATLVREAGGRRVSELRPLRDSQASARPKPPVYMFPMHVIALMKLRAGVYTLAGLIRGRRRGGGQVLSSGRAHHP